MKKEEIKIIELVLDSILYYVAFSLFLILSYIELESSHIKEAIFLVIVATIFYFSFLWTYKFKLKRIFKMRIHQ